MKVVCDIKESSVTAFEDVYEKGDRWEKIQGCEVCSLERRRQCCWNCDEISDLGKCKIHGMQKPFKCVIYPTPIKHQNGCMLVFKSIKGSKKGKIRRVGQPRNIFE